VLFGYWVLLFYWLGVAVKRKVPMRLRR
jgi:hypothetical protein